MEASRSSAKRRASDLEVARDVKEQRFWVVGRITGYASYAPHPCTVVGVDTVATLLLGGGRCLRAVTLGSAQGRSPKPACVHAYLCV
jgi:hypothetical protein